MECGGRGAARIALPRGLLQCRRFLTTRLDGYWEIGTRDATRSGLLAACGRSVRPTPPNWPGTPTIEKCGCNCATSRIAYTVDEMQRWLHRPRPAYWSPETMLERHYGQRRGGGRDRRQTPRRIAPRLAPQAWSAARHAECGRFREARRRRTGAARQQSKSVLATGDQFPHCLYTHTTMRTHCHRPALRSGTPRHVRDYCQRRGGWRDRRQTPRRRGALLGGGRLGSASRTGAAASCHARLRRSPALPLPHTTWNDCTPCPTPRTPRHAACCRRPGIDSRDACAGAPSRTAR